MKEAMQAKDAVRRQMRARRKALTPEERERAAQVVCAKLRGDSIIAKATDPSDGGGWYDRLLASASKSARKIGVAHEFQIHDDLPHEPHDIRMDGVVTDTLLDSHLDFTETPDGFRA